MKLINTDKKILIVGLGLLGGSYAKALTKKGFTVTAITKEQSSIDYAVSNRIIEKGTTEIDAQIIAEADIVIFALYPHIFIDWIKENQHLFKSGTIITDVTGVKESIVYEVQKMLRDDVEFIAAHPMAGREVSGVENSDDSIFSGANYIVVPTEYNSKEAVDFCCDLGRILGFADVSILSPQKHDEMIAFLSQLTHCIAVSLMCTNEDNNLVRYTGDSFRDLTRIARINDEMWSELFLANREQLLKQMDLFKEKFEELYQTVFDQNIEKMRQMMRTSSERRSRFDKKEKR